MTTDDFLAREARERELWDRYPIEMGLIAPGDLPDYPTSEQKRVHAQWRDLYRRVLRGEITPLAALAIRAAKGSL